MGPGLRYGMRLSEGPGLGLMLGQRLGLGPRLVPGLGL